MKDETIIAISAISSITILEGINLIVTGIDSTVFTVVVSTISGFVGYMFGKKSPSKKLKKKSE